MASEDANSRRLIRGIQVTVDDVAATSAQAPRCSSAASIRTLSISDGLRRDQCPRLVNQNVRRRVGSTLIGTRDACSPESCALKPPMMKGTVRFSSPEPAGSVEGTCTSTSPTTGLGGRPPPTNSLDSAAPQNSACRYDFAVPRLVLHAVSENVSVGAFVLK